MKIRKYKTINLFILIILIILTFINFFQKQYKFTDGNKNISSINNLVKVIKVIDGDTIEIEGGKKVRYIGINTPETVDKRKAVECFGIEASKENKKLIEGKTIRLEKDISETDKYGRLLRYVYINDIFVNLELVKNGYAYSSTFPPDVKYQTQLDKAEKEARKNKLGLWDVCK